jgi:hypothetical protein
MFNVIHGTGVAKIDFIVRKETESRVSPEDLLLSKLSWAKQGECRPSSREGQAMRDLHDTSPERAELYVRLLAQRSGEERFLMGREMFESSRALVSAGLAARERWTNEVELRVLLFQRFYEQDYSQAERERIVDALRSWPDRR